MALKGRFVPACFWGDIDDVAWRTALIFEPLVNLLDVYRPQSADQQTEARDFYQELHTVLTIAAYFQICTAISPSIFHHLSATPGARMDYPIEQQAEVALYRESKEVNETLDAQWEEAQDNLANKQAVAQTDLDRLNALFPIPLPTSPNYEQEKRTARHHRLRGAKIKLAVFPMVRRYTPENRGVMVAPDTAAPDNWEMVEGQRISDIFRCTVIYYQGLVYPRDVREDGVQLDTHLTSLTGRVRLPTQFSLVGYMILGFMMFMGGIFMMWLYKVVAYDATEANAFISSNIVPFRSYIEAPRNYVQQEFEANDKSLANIVCKTFCDVICRGLCVCNSIAPE